LVSVGGDKVNTVTAQLLAGQQVDWNSLPGQMMVKQVVQGSKIVVAGANAENTLAAAAVFVSELTQN
jgi:hypothetical protein